MSVDIRFAGAESVEYSFAVPLPMPTQDSDNLPNSDDPETDHDQSNDVQQEFELDTSKCPVCCSKMDYEVVMECEATCVVCHEENVQCLVSCMACAWNPVILSIQDKIKEINELIN